MRRTIPIVFCGLSLAAATTWANGQGEPSVTPEAAQVQQLNQQIQVLRQTASLTPLVGPGVVMELRDKTVAAKNHQPSDLSVVHDFDLLQVVNELRANKAEGIAVNGVRLTNYTSIRCQGTKVYIGQQLVNHPYKVEAIGNPETLGRALSIKDGVMSQLRQAGIEVRLSRPAQIHLAASGNAPAFQFGKAE